MGSKLMETELYAFAYRLHFAVTELFDLDRYKNLYFIFFHFPGGIIFPALFLLWHTLNRQIGPWGLLGYAIYFSLIPFVVLYIQQGTLSTESFVPTQPALQILLSLMAIYSIAVVLILFPINTFRSGIRRLCVVLNLLMFSTIWGIFNGWFFASWAFAHPNTESSQWHGFLAAIMVTILMWTTLLPALGGILAHSTRRRFALRCAKILIGLILIVQIYLLCEHLVESFTQLSSGKRF